MLSLEVLEGKMAEGSEQRQGMEVTPPGAVGRDALDGLRLGNPSALGCWRLNQSSLAWRE